MGTGFIVIDGLDGAGGETQTKLLVNYFKRNRIGFVKIESPNYSTEIGKVIKDFLNCKLELEPEARFLLFGTDVIMNKPIIEGAKKEGKFVIADRYITSTIAYQVAAGLNLNNLIKVSELMGFPKPDIIILIDIKPETSMKRKMKEKGDLDRHEKDLKYLSKVREAYLKEASLNVLGKWFIVNGEKSIEEVHKEILKIVHQFFKI
ncbi:MAG TPA: dTMP kinase [Candidatus Aenigmarchaeota archaeon]|nr:dTMP kinase [Candidatus Aenigmarchaeota archaeon]